MPQINKLRIVNFKYNDGNRFIPDELYDLSSPESGKALNTLFNLDNGGGKTVLTHLMMQPVKPKAMAGHRRIEDYFEHPGDHSYVLIEWILDESREKLLTGIAIAASMSSSSEDNSRGNTIKYYTFTSHYELYSSYSIAELELSKNENGKYVPESFEYVREKARLSRGALVYYSSDDAVKWADYLSEYGLSRDEWEMVIERLNEDEGGLSKYFDDANTSGKLIAKFFIPAIEQKMMSVASKGTDSSLDTMLINHAKAISDKESVINQRDTNKKLLGDLAAVSETSDKLYDLKAALIANVAEARGFEAAINRQISCLDVELNHINLEIDKRNELIDHIAYEEKSKAYYVAEEVYLQAKIKQEEARDILDKCKAALDEKKHDEEILQCAKLNREIIESDGKIREIKKLIEDKENNSEDSERIANLKYSIFAKAKDVEKEHESKAAEIDGNIEIERKLISEFKSAKETAEKERDEAKEKSFIAEATLEANKKNTDKRIESLQIDVIRKFDGFYADEEIEAERLRKVKNKSDKETKLQRLVQSIDEINRRIEQIPGEKAEITIKKEKLTECLEKADAALNEYDSQVESLTKICGKYNLDSSSIFSDKVRAFIRRKIEVTEAEIVTKNHSVEVLEVKKKAAEDGYLHILPEIMDYVRSTGLNPITGEAYICSLLEDGFISNDKADEILASYPEVAYSLLFTTEKDIQKLLSAGNLDWIPAAVPLFTMDQVSHIIDGNMESLAFLTAYDKKYFADRSGFISHISEEITQTEERLENLRTSINEAKEDKHIADSFDYEEHWRSEQEKRIASLVEQISTCEQALCNLASEHESLKQELENCKDEQSECKKSIHDIDKWLDSCSELSSMLSEEVEAFNKSQDASIAWRNAENVYTVADDELNKHIKALDDLNANAADCASLLDEVRDVLRKVDNAKESDILDGDYKSLLSQYNMLIGNLNASLEGLRNNLDNEINNKSAAESQLAAYSCEKKEYENVVFSSESYRRAKKDRENCEKEKEIKQDEFTVRNGEYAAAETALKKAREALAEHNEMPLPKGEIGDSFKARIKVAKNEINELKERSVILNDEKRSHERIADKAGAVLSDYIAEVGIKEVVLGDKPEDQWKTLSDKLRTSKREYEKKETELINKIHSIASAYKNIALGEIVSKLEAIGGMLVDADLKGDRLFTVSESISMMIASIEKINSKIETDLKEIDNDFNDLVNQCFLQAKRIYNDLRLIANSSRAHIYEGKPQVQMLKIDLPDEKDISEEASRISIKNEIETGANELKELLGKADDRQIIRKARSIVGSEKLLHRFIVSDANIPVRVYKIDLNSSNSSYKTWEDALKQNSGGEKFVVFFSVVLALMNYNRAVSGVTSKNAKSVLILDNPFGKITSEHLLKPMFDIAKHFNVQLICLSDIDKSAVTSCFECVIKLVIRQQGPSSMEIMTHEGNERIEHGYYKFKSGQMSLF